MANFVVTVDGNKASQVRKEFDKSKIDAFIDVVQQAYKKNPKEKDLAELRKWLNEFPELWHIIFDASRLIEENFVRNMVQERAAIIALHKNIEEIRNGLAYNKSSMMEMLLIDNIVVSWLSVQYATYQMTTRMNQEEKIVILEFWERRLTAAQKRYLRACETLTRVRRLMSAKPNVQVNIAANGGQQVNVAGDIGANQQK
jgi:hypothetical protein